jgi:hypothetical protein
MDVPWHDAGPAEPAPNAPRKEPGTMGPSDPTFSTRLMAAETWPRYRRIGPRIRNTILIALALIVPGIICAAFGSNLGPAWAAHEGHGTPGTWTATAEECDKSCTWTGTFEVPTTSHTYTIPAGPDGPARTYIAPMWGYDLDGTALGGGTEIDHMGQSVPAVYTGGYVFPRGGGSDWRRDTIWTALGGTGVLTWLWIFPRRALRRLRLSYAARRCIEYSQR